MRDVHGLAADGFDGVRAAFAAAVNGPDGDPDAQLAVFQDGRKVVDLWAAPDGENAVTALYSTAKGAAHLVVAMLVQDGTLKLDQPVSEIWPEFSGFGKERLTLRGLLAHRSGLIGVDGGFTDEELADDRRLAARLAGQRPFWEPGTAYGYHAFVIAALTGEVVVRATGRTIREHYEERIRGPRGLDFFFGLPESEESRYIPVLPPAKPIGRVPADTLTGVAFNAAAPQVDDHGEFLVRFANSRYTRALGPGSAGGVGSARGVAAMYAAAIGDGTTPGLLTADTIVEFTRPQDPGTDLVTGETNHFALGFEVQSHRYPELGAASFGHSGATGTQSFADPASGIAFSYVRRRFAVGGGGGARENAGLVTAVMDAAR
ncbi:serine hydrolase domain-containing protein [Actinomadura harenae]|uniref:Class A beta-lactamase-related serine hydrolase n=1 Tax=Actinomadura harenae TaxID=2483351 RepID=A0A3M2LRN6_9ACTN|nr:serine hydrolase domain-containing protein [Actinomadura harenae]RMI39560.1 class A beta-lactamase-related serine hydrolase [Actinomadura harenae]